MQFLVTLTVWVNKLNQLHYKIWHFEKSCINVFIFFSSLLNTLVLSASNGNITEPTGCRISPVTHVLCYGWCLYNIALLNFESRSTIGIGASEQVYQKDVLTPSGKHVLVGYSILHLKDLCFSLLILGYISQKNYSRRHIPCLNKQHSPSLLRGKKSI